MTILLILAVLLQTLSAIIALSMIPKSGNYFWAWLFISLALFLMIQRRIYPLYLIIIEQEKNPESVLMTLLGFLISLCMTLGFLGISNLFSQIQLKNKELHRVSMEDFLTRVYNRRYLLQIAQQEIIKVNSTYKPLSLLIIDVDFFKKVNDTYGHQTGDIVLFKIADICQQSIRKSDILGRYGGEEFLIILPNTSLKNAVLVADNLREVIAEEEIVIEGKTINVTISIGVSEWQYPEMSIDKMLKRADSCLYWAKKNGRNQVCFES